LYGRRADTAKMVAEAATMHLDSNFEVEEEGIRMSVFMLAKY
jgi:hypothetical protein